MATAVDYTWAFLKLFAQLGKKWQFWILLCPLREQIRNEVQLIE